MSRSALPALAATALALTLAACGTATSGAAAGSSEPTASSPAATGSASAGTTGSAAGEAAAPGAYVTLAEYRGDPAAYEGSKVVYFFHATWCPSCRATDAAIGESGVPDGLTVVKVDYDTETGLRQQYGVTQQHTFVQVDGSGAELAKWTGSADGAAILAGTV
jgi:thioredoxin 1